MRINRAAMAACLAALCAPFSFASPNFPVVSFAASPGDGPGVPVVSSSSSLPDAPDAAASYLEQAGKSQMSYGPETGLRLQTAPFSMFAMGITLGADGLGFQVATPLATKMNLRAGFSFFNYDPRVTEDGIPIDGAIKFRSVSAGVDVYPYRGSFHVTPGVTMYNGNHAQATTNIAGGASFTINDTNYVSSPVDPVHGLFVVDFGHRFAPSLTAGFGNMLRRDSHWSIPTEFGVQYIGQPKFTLHMQGTVCDTADGCTPIQSDPGTVANLQQEQATVNREIQFLRFYPIATVGVSYRFGRNRKMDLWR